MPLLVWEPLEAQAGGLEDPTKAPAHRALTRPLQSPVREGSSRTGLWWPWEPTSELLYTAHSFSNHVGKKDNVTPRLWDPNTGCLTKTGDLCFSPENESCTVFSSNNSRYMNSCCISVTDIQGLQHLLSQWVSCHCACGDILPHPCLIYDESKGWQDGLRGSSRARTRAQDTGHDVHFIR